jgi:hypothetical protein
MQIAVVGNRMPKAVEPKTIELKSIELKSMDLRFGP